MFRTKLKNMIILSTCVTLAFSCIGCSSSQKKTPDKEVSEMLMLDTLSENNASVSNVYNTVEVTLGDISETDAAMGSVSFPISYEITHDYDYGTVTFQSFFIKSLGTTFISKGEVIASLKLNIEPIAKEEARIKYEKALQAYENSIEKKEKDLENILRNVNEETNIYQKQILELDYQVALKSYEEYVVSQEEYLSELQTTMDLYGQETTEILLTSPCDGLLRTNSGFSMGDVIEPGTILATVNSLEEIIVNARTSSFNYGTLVDIMLSSNTPIILQGKVVSSNNILYNAKCDYTTIEIISELPDFSTLSSQAISRLTIVANTNHATNSLLIPRSALTEYKGNTGVVYVHENGLLSKKNIKYGYIGKEYVWVLEGLELGQEVTTK